MTDVFQGDGNRKHFRCNSPFILRRLLDQSWDHLYSGRIRDRRIVRRRDGNVLQRPWTLCHGMPVACIARPFVLISLGMVYLHLPHVAAYASLDIRIQLTLLLCVAHVPDACDRLPRSHHHRRCHCTQLRFDQGRRSIWYHRRLHCLVEHAGWYCGSFQQSVLDTSCTLPMVRQGKTKEGEQN